MSKLVYFCSVFIFIVLLVIVLCALAIFHLSLLYLHFISALFQKTKQNKKGHVIVLVTLSKLTGCLFLTFIKAGLTLQEL